MPVIDDGNHPASGIVQEWLHKIKDAEKQKKEKFGKYADEALKFFDGAHDWMWKGAYAKAPGGFLDKEAQGAMPTFRMTVNRVFEAVALFGPVLYHRNPRIQVTPRTIPDISPESLGMQPGDQQAAQAYQILKMQQDAEGEIKRTHAGLKEHYLNWLQDEANKKTQCRMAINEAIIKGMGLLWTELYRPGGSGTSYPRSYYVSVDDLVLDPDAKYWEDVQWVARKVIHPTWQVEREYGLPDGELKGSRESLRSQATQYAGNRRKSSGEKRSGQSFDLIEYWQVYSKAGFGDRLKSIDRQSAESKFDFETFGDFCFLAVADDIPYPLNLPTPAFSQLGDEDLFMRAQWPIPFWTDGGWPFSALSFYEKPGEVWPISLIKPAIGELRFVNWCMSFLADKVAAASTTYVAVAKAAGAEIQDQIKSGLGPYTHIEISDLFGKSVKDMVSFLDAPSFNVDIWRMVSEVLEMIDKRTGLTELIYGLSGSTQIRSATEADVRNQNVSVRPDDMASRVEDWLSLCALKEIEAAEWMLSGKDVAPVLGGLGAQIWDTQIRQQDFERTIREYDYRIEAGSARKPNPVNRIRQLNEFAQIAMPVLQNFVGQGLIEPYNALIEDWAKANELDPERYIITKEVIQQREQQQMQMQMQAQQQEAQQQQQDPAIQAQQQQAQMDMQMKQMEMQIKQTEAQSKSQVAQQEVQAKQIDLRVQQQEHQQELQQDSEKHDQEVEQAREAHQLEMDFMREKIKAEKERREQ